MISFYVLVAQAANSDKLIQEIYGTDNQQKFSYHRPTYFIFGTHDAKMQFSFKYRLAKAIPLYLGYTQLNLWNIYKTSQPFTDVNYSPELFYRIIEKEEKRLMTLDMGYTHLSNGKAGRESRSFEKIYLRSNYSHKIERHNLNFNLMLFDIVSAEKTNEDIVKHLGYWELTVLLSDLVVVKNSSLSLEYRTYAGSKLYNINQGGNQVGLLWDFKSEDISPSIYFQMFKGYAESLFTYNIQSEEYRIGFMLTF